MLSNLHYTFLLFLLLWGLSSWNFGIYFFSSEIRVRVSVEGKEGGECGLMRSFPSILMHGLNYVEIFFILELNWIFFFIVYSFTITTRHNTRNFMMCDIWRGRWNSNWVVSYNRNQPENANSPNFPSITFSSSKIVQLLKIFNFISMFVGWTQHVKRELEKYKK